MKVEKILLLMDNSRDSNWGSQATTAMLIELLKKRFGGAEVRGVPRTKCRPHGNLRRSACTWLAPQLVSSGGPCWVLDALAREWIDDFEWADFVVVNGEGTMHPQPQAIRWITSIVALARKFKKPYWVVNCSIQCIGDKTQPLFEVFFKESSYVAVREVESHRELSSLGVLATLAADCAFLAGPSSESEAREILQRVGVTGPFAVMTGSASVRKWPIEHQREVVAFLKAQGMAVLYSHSDIKDEENRRQISLVLPAVSHRDTTYQQLIAIQSLAQVLVGGRFHPTIFAAKYGIPFVALQSNTHKMSGLMEMLGCQELLHQFSDLAQVIPTVKRVLSSRDEWSKRLVAASVPLIDAAKLNVSGLNQLP